MKATGMKTLSDKELEELLGEWRLEGHEVLPQSAVWRRIAARESEDRVAGWFDWAAIARLALRPGFVGAALLGFALLGLAAAEMRWQWERQAVVESLEVQYFRSIDPVSMAAAHRHEPETPANSAR